jgi:hypothetical protein
MTKSFFKLLKTVLLGYPYDSTYLLEIERDKILEMVNHFEKVLSGERFGLPYEGMETHIRYMKIAARLIDIIIDDCKLWHYDENIFRKVSDNGHIIFVDKNGNPTEDDGYRCDVNVNTRNIDRFLTKSDDKEYCLKHPHEIYWLKARYLYHKIRFEQELSWWE